MSVRTTQEMGETGIEVIELGESAGFQSRRLHVRDVGVQMEGVRRLTRAFVDRPDTLLQELARAAVDLCGAESAGISLEREDRTDEAYFEWVATAGRYERFLHAMLPRFPSACKVCLDRGTPQLFRVTQRFFDLMGIEAPTVTDGMLFPWQVGTTRGTIWVMAHGAAEAFDQSDCGMMQLLADFAAMAVRHQRQQLALVEQARAAAASEMANELAHEINNPLQSLTNVVYLAAEGCAEGDAQSLARELSGPLDRLSVLAKKLLVLPKPGQRSRAS